jgi:Copper transport outer membrane protein, MctB
MINFRFHLVSIIAVFLALALGIAMGATVISQGIVDTLNDQIDRVEQNADATNAENNALSTQIDRVEDYMEATAPYLVAGRLNGAAVVVVAARGVDGEVVSRTVELAQTAGADAPGTLWLEESWSLSDPAQADQMADLLGRPASLPRGPLRRDAWNALAERLAAGPPPYASTENAQTAADGTDLLTALIDAGFVSYESVGDDSDINDMPDLNARALLIDGTTAEIPPDDVVARGTRALLKAGFPVVVAEVYQEQEDGPDRGARVAPVRDDGALVEQASTVDDLDQAEGSTTTVLVLSDPDVIGHYGYGSGAQAAVPEPEPTEG